MTDETVEQLRFLGLDEAANEMERLRAIIDEWAEAEMAELRHFPPGLDAKIRGANAREALFNESKMMRAIQESTDER